MNEHKPAARGWLHWLGLRLRPLLCRVGAHEWADTRKVTEVHHTRFHPDGRGNYMMTEDQKTYPMQQCKHCMEARNEN